MPAHGLDLVAADRTLALAATHLDPLTGGQMALRSHLSPIASQYDWIVLDCPPSLDLLTVSTLVAADAVLIPTVPRILDSRGIGLLLQTVGDLRRLNPLLRLLGIAVVQCEPRLSDTQEVLAWLASQGLPVLTTTVRRAAAIAGAVRYGVPAVLLPRRSPGAADYWELSREVRARAEAAD